MKKHKILTIRDVCKLGEQETIISGQSSAYKEGYTDGGNDRQDEISALPISLKDLVDVLAVSKIIQENKLVGMVKHYRIDKSWADKIAKDIAVNLDSIVKTKEEK